MGSAPEAGTRPIVPILDLIERLARAARGAALEAVPASPDVRAEAAALVAAFVHELEGDPTLRFYLHSRLDKTAGGRRILAAPPDVGAALALAFVERVAGGAAGAERRLLDADVVAACHLLERRPALSPEQARFLLRYARAALAHSFLAEPTAEALVRCLDDHLAGAPPPPDWLAPLGELTDWLERRARSAPARRVLGRVRAWRSGAPTERLVAGEPWADRARADLAAMPETERAAWDALLAHAARARAARPTRTWLATAAARQAAVGSAAWRRVVPPWLAAFQPPGQVGDAARRAPDEHNADVLKGLVWTCGVAGDPAFAAPLGDLAERAMRRVPNVGPYCRRVAHACLWSLARLPGAEAVAQLGRLGRRVRYGTTKELAARALDRAAEAAGLTRAELEERSVATAGLDPDHRLERTIGDDRFVVEVTGTGRVEATWVAPDGRRRRAARAAVRHRWPQAVRDAVALRRAVEQAARDQRDRLERLLAEQRAWSVEAWRARYLDHALVGALARRLVWRFGAAGAGATGTWWRGALVDARGRPLPVGAGDAVGLWHPVEASVEEVQAWRAWLEDRELEQPFRQAHREIYVLTDAERATGTYSNRFAAHVLSQHRLAALCRQRGWAYAMHGAEWGGGSPCRRIGSPALVAEYRVEGVRHGPQSAAGVCLHVTTDRVSFGDRPLVDVPARVFSETMRDVDLFVGVASVGSDPAWVDGGWEQPFVAYWHDYAAGPLTARGEARRDALVRLLPRLRIAARCELSERYLVVQGTRDRYRIHLGSANVLRESNGQYVCIVPGSGGGEAARRGTGASPLFVPFEGDPTLAVVLSKAFLLADDARIDDPAILEQLAG